MPTTNTVNEQSIEIECTSESNLFKQKKKENKIIWHVTIFIGYYALSVDRQRMKDYWVKHSAQASIQEMMLDSNAEVISDSELPEILSILPSFKSKVVLELGAGIG